MTEPTDVRSAINTLAPLLEGLESAYWDSSEIPVKDRIFDLVTLVHAELNELAKLSVSDLEYPYETISPGFTNCCAKLQELMQNINDWFPRSQTAEKLKESLPKAASLLSFCQL